MPTPRRGQLPEAFDPQTGNFRTTSDNTRTGNPVDFERDPGIRMRMFARESKPWYKPEYWDRVMFNDVHGHSALAPDPTFQCMPAGVPRIGMPQEIMQNDKQMVFLYPLHQRRIYIDGRPHPPEDQWLGTWFGHSVGKWEGDTLVVETRNFTDKTQSFYGAGTGATLLLNAAVDPAPSRDPALSQLLARPVLRRLRPAPGLPSPRPR